jgi:hypothetical protein
MTSKLLPMWNARHAFVTQAEIARNERDSVPKSAVRAAYWKGKSEHDAEKYNRLCEKIDSLDDQIMKEPVISLNDLSIKASVVGLRTKEGELDRTLHMQLVRDVIEFGSAEDRRSRERAGDSV